MLCASTCLALALLAPVAASPASPSPLTAADTVPVVAPSPASAAPAPAGADLRPLRAPPTFGAPRGPLPDTLPQEAVEYSDAYFTRLTIHRYASYATLPLFVAQYVAGEQLMRKGNDAPGWARDAHGALATGVAALFGVNTVTGGWNLWESRRDPEGRTRRMLHGVMMLAADAGFAATGLLAEDAEESGGRRNLHKTVAISSMGVSLLSYAVMLPVFGNR
jgi:hypothetical protein